MPKKAVFFLLLMLVSASLSTLLYHKYGKEEVKESKLESLEIQLSELLKNKKHCFIGAGLNLRLKPLDLTHHYQVESLEGLPKELEGQIKEGDVLVSETFSYSGEAIGSTQDLVVVRPSSGLIRTLPFTVKPFVSCF
jgi:hypothetical protein